MSSADGGAGKRFCLREVCPGGRSALARDVEGEIAREEQRQSALLACDGRLHVTGLFILAAGFGLIFGINVFFALFSGYVAGTLKPGAGAAARIVLQSLAISLF